MSTPSSNEAPSDTSNVQLAAIAAIDMERAFEDAPFGYLLTTPNGLIVRVNETLLSMTGYESDDLVGKRRFVDLLTVGGRLYHETHFAPMLQMQGSTHTIALELVCAEGKRLPILVTSKVDSDANGSPVLVRTTVIDATERRSYEQELLHAKRLADIAEAKAVALSRTLQQTFIPRDLPEIPGLELGAVYRPAGALVGGDFYDVFQTGNRSWVITIGDVSGKGPEAAIITSLVRHTLHAAIVDHSQLSVAFGTVNRVMLRDRGTHFCTAAIVWLRQSGEQWTVTVSSAGHPLPLLCRNGSIEEIGRSGSLLGVLTNAQFHDTTVELEPDDTIVLYTDGITEGRKQHELFGDERLHATIAKHVTGHSLAGSIADEVIAFQGDQVRDDIAVVAIKTHGTAS